jgi:pyruvate/2-oxoglutarate dehydrogenase complex dihydrolipoamide acyltransferase (E2) component
MSSKPPNPNSKAPPAPAKPTSQDAKSPAPDSKPSVRNAPTGRVQFDDRGNAVWEWAVKTGAFARDVVTDRLKRLEHPGLSLADEAPPPAGPIAENPLGAKKGYNPYESGKLGEAEKPRKKDLRRLGEWLKLRKQADRKKRGD